MAQRMKKDVEDRPRSDSEHQAGRRAKRRTGQPPLTPMIDVTFQLLLFFLLTCEFREMEGFIPGSLPSRSGRIDDLEPVKVTLHRSAAGTAYYRLDGSTGMIGGPERLYRALMNRQAVLGTADAPVLIEPRADVPWQYVVEAFNQAKRARYTKIGFSDVAA